ncbi:hypothetical protein ACUSIJ_10360 [Pseudochelatococcus sp. B33]
MKHIEVILRAALALAPLMMLGAMTMTPVPAAAVVYCKTVGVPKGCVARPAAPARARAAVYCTAPGLPVGCVAKPRARAAVPGTPMNRGGPVNRVGRW